MSEELHASPLLRWPESISNLEQKQAAAARAAERLTDGQLVGIGSSPNAYLILWAVARRASEQRLNVVVVCSSYETETAALHLGLKLGQLGSVEPDWGVDGADEIDPANRMLKCHGGGLVKDELLWSTTKQMYLAAGPAHFVETLGAELPLPIEVHRDAVESVARGVVRLGATDVQLRLATGKDGPVITESGNLLLDVRFPELIRGLGAEIKRLPGAIETGLFEDYEFETL